MGFCKSTNKTLKLVGRAGSASRLDSGLLKRGKRTELKKYSSTLKGYLSLSVQSVHICIVICLFTHFVFNFKDRTTMREKECPGPLGHSWALYFLQTKTICTTAFVLYLIKKFTCLSLGRNSVSHGQPAEHLVQALLLIVRWMLC